MKRTLLGIISAGTGAAAFASWFFAIWSEDQGLEWLCTAVLLSFTAWATGMLASDE